MHRNYWFIGILASPIILLIVLVLGSFIHGFILSALGYYVNDTGLEVAIVAAEKHDVRICQKMRQTWFMIGPQAGEQRALCIHEYAELTKDPSACELLMPGDYGWSCLGNISGQLFSGRLCTRSGSLDHIELYCNRESEGELSIDRPQIEDCSLYERTDLREWCNNTRTELLKGVYECQNITRDVVRDHCEYNYALKMRDPSLCSSIRDAERRAFCDVRVSMTVKYR